MSSSWLTLGSRSPPPSPLPPFLAPAPSEFRSVRRSFVAATRYITDLPIRRGIPRDERFTALRASTLLPPFLPRRRRCIKISISFYFCPRTLSRAIATATVAHPCLMAGRKASPPGQSQHRCSAALNLASLRARNDRCTEDTSILRLAQTSRRFEIFNDAFSIVQQIYIAAHVAAFQFFRSDRVYELGHDERVAQSFRKNFSSFLFRRSVKVSPWSKIKAPRDDRRSPISASSRINQSAVTLARRPSNSATRPSTKDPAMETSGRGGGGGGGGGPGLG